MKVEHTKTHTIQTLVHEANTHGPTIKFVNVLVTDAELVLVDTGTDGDYPDYSQQIIGVNHRWVKPYLISRTEKIEVGDWIYDIDLKNIKQATELQARVANKGFNYYVKIVALPEHFSPQQLQDIVNGKLKEGKCLVECEARYYNEKNQEITLEQASRVFADFGFNSGHKLINQIKLNPHITIYPVEKKMYTREEVKKLISKAFSSDLINSQSASELDAWMDLNVK